MGLFSVIGGLFGGGALKKGSQQATNALVGAYNRGIDTQNAQFQQTRQDFMPFTTAGTSAITRIGDFQGLNGDAARAGAFTNLEADPRYQALFDQGQETLLQNAAATGGIRGGNTAGALAQLSPAVLASVYQSVLGELQGTASLGLGASGTVASAGANNANNVTGLLGNIGTAQAGNFLTKAGINARNFQNIGGLLDQAAQAGMPGAGGGGFSLGNALKSVLG